MTIVSRSGLRVTAPMGVQLRVLPDQRAGLASRARVYNPIVPYFRQVPKWWERNGHNFETAAQIVNGYLDFFEPDFLVEAEPGLARDLGFDKERVVQLSDVLTRANQRYRNVSTVVARFDYPRCSKAERGVVRAYLMRISLYSCSQLTRLMARCSENRLSAVPLAKRYRSPAEPFKRKFSVIDIVLMVEMARANEDVCGPAIVHLLQRACHAGPGRR